MTGYEAASDLIEPVIDAPANRSSRVYVREVVTIRETVNLNDGQEIMNVEAWGPKHRVVKDARKFWTVVDSSNEAILVVSPEEMARGVPGSSRQSLIDERSNQYFKLCVSDIDVILNATTLGFEGARLHVAIEGVEVPPISHDHNDVRFVFYYGVGCPRNMLKWHSWPALGVWDD